MIYIPDKREKSDEREAPNLVFNVMCNHFSENKIIQVWWNPNYSFGERKITNFIYSLKLFRKKLTDFGIIQRKNDCLYYIDDEDDLIPIESESEYSEVLKFGREIYKKERQYVTIVVGQNANVIKNSKKHLATKRYSNILKNSAESDVEAEVKDTNNSENSENFDHQTQETKLSENGFCNKYNLHENTRTSVKKPLKRSLDFSLYRDRIKIETDNNPSLIDNAVNYKTIYSFLDNNDFNDYEIISSSKKNSKIHAEEHDESRDSNVECDSSSSIDNFEYLKFNPEELGIGCALNSIIKEFNSLKSNFSIINNEIDESIKSDDEEQEVQNHNDVKRDMQNDDNEYSDMRFRLIDDDNNVFDFESDDEDIEFTKTQSHKKTTDKNKKKIKNNTNTSHLLLVFLQLFFLLITILTSLLLICMVVILIMLLFFITNFNLILYKYQHNNISPHDINHKWSTTIKSICSAAVSVISEIHSVVYKVYKKIRHDMS